MQMTVAFFTLVHVLADQIQDEFPNRLFLLCLIKGATPGSSISFSRTQIEECAGGKSKKEQNTE